MEAGFLKKFCHLLIFSVLFQLKVDVMYGRSFPDLQVVGESSLMSILRWNFKTNMEKTLCSSDDAQLVLVSLFVNGYCVFSILFST